MSTVVDRPRTASVPTSEVDHRRDLLEILFLATAFLAPMHLSIYRALTAYDVAAVGLAFLTLVGPTRMRWIPTSLRIAGLLLLLAGLVSAFRSTYPMEALAQVLQYAFALFILLPIVLTLVRSRTTLHAALIMFILGYLVVVALSALIQESRIAGRALPFFQETNANALAVPTIFLMPFVLHLMFDAWRRQRRLSALLGGGAALYTMLWALAASGSRGATGATIISAGLFLAWRHERGFNLKVVARVVGVLVALAALGGVLYWTGAFPDTLRARIERSFTSEEEVEVEDERLVQLRAGIYAFLDSPLIGTGFDNFRHVAQAYDDGAVDREPPNLWIQLLAQTGIVGAAAMVFILGRWFLLMFQARSVARNRSDRELLWAFIASMTGVTAHTMLSPVLVGRYYWLLYGLGIVAAAFVARSSEPSEDGAPMGPASRETLPT
jgi:O-antigen ligase